MEHMSSLQRETVGDDSLDIEIQQRTPQENEGIC